MYINRIETLDKFCAAWDWKSTQDNFDGLKADQINLEAEVKDLQDALVAYEGLYAGLD